LKTKIKNKWIIALKSKKYRQGTLFLNKGDKMCPLGVLCDISKLGKWAPIYDPESKYYEYVIDDNNKGSYTIPKKVVEWGEINDILGPRLEYNGETKYLFQFNDNGIDFKTLAKLIKEQL